MGIRKGLQVILKLITCTLGGVAAWLALSTFASTIYENAIEGFLHVKAWHCAAFGLVAGIGWAVGYKTKWGRYISAALMGWSITIGFQLLGLADAPWPVYLVLSLLILAVFMVLTGGGIYGKKESVE